MTRLTILLFLHIYADLCLIVLAPLNSQMCIHLCNKGFMQCSPISLSLHNYRWTVPADTVGLCPALTFSFKWGRVALLFFLTCQTNTWASSRQYVPTTPISDPVYWRLSRDLNADVTVPLKTPATLVLTSSTDFVTEASANHVPSINAVSRSLSSSPCSKVTTNWACSA